MPLDVEGYRLMKAVGIGTYQIFQESYHRPTYTAMHPRGTRPTTSGASTAGPRHAGRL